MTLVGVKCNVRTRWQRSDDQKQSPEVTSVVCFCGPAYRKCKNKKKRRKQKKKTYERVFVFRLNLPLSCIVDVKAVTSLFVICICVRQSETPFSSFDDL